MCKFNMLRDLNPGFFLLSLPEKIFAMDVTLQEVVSASQMKTFVGFPYRHYKGNAFWVPPLRSDERRSLKAETNPAFSYCEVKLWLAFKNRQCAGRIAAVINHDYNRKTGEQMGRISRMEFVDDAAVSSSLFRVAEEWLRAKGMKAVHGPLGFSNLDVQGLLIEGFEYLPSIGSVYHFPYYQLHFEANVYVKENDWVEFLLSVGEIPEKALRLTEIVKKRFGLRSVSFSSRKELQAYGEKIFKVFNESFTELPYVSPMNDKMISFYASKYLGMLNPEYVKVIEDNTGEPVAFVVSIPSMSRAMQKARGRLFPFGFLYLLSAMRKADTADLLLAGVKPAFQRLGLIAILIEELQTVMIKKGIKKVETTGMFESNHKAIETWKSFDYIHHKRRRCYRKAL
jgi:ribosomal protein S18 acetylase RimI-like enzyme